MNGEELGTTGAREDRERILSALRPRVHDGQIHCRDALEIAAALQVRPILIGQVCDQNQIRIINCQLGCFGTRRKKRD